MLTVLCGRSRSLWPRIECEIAEALRAGAEKILLLTPAQYTLQAELDLVDGLNLPGLIRVQVLSPESLARLVFLRAGAPEGTRLDGRGRAMALEAALRHASAPLKYYQSAAGRRGFRERVGTAVAAFKQARLSPQEVRQAAAALGEGDSLGAKLADLATVFSAYEASLSGNFLDAEDVREAVCERLLASGFAQGARVWCYGFDLVTPQLMRLVAELARLSESVRFALAWEAEDAPDGTVFQPARDTLARFARYLDAQGMLWRREIVREDGGAAPALAYLHRSLFAPQAPPYAGECACIRLTAAADPSDEAARIAQSVRSLALDGAPLEELAVVFGDAGQCAGPLARALSRAGVPFHLDEKRPALSHPLPRALLLSVRCACEGFRPDDMADLIKSGLVGVSGDACDALENYARAKGLRGAQWEKEAEDPQVESARVRLVEPLVRLRTGLRDAHTAEESVGALYRWLEDAQAYAALEEWEASFAARGMHEQAADCAQAWRLTMETLDQLCALLRGARLAMKDAPRVLEAGLSAAELGALPELPGAVHCGLLGHIKLGAKVRAVFLMGMQDGILRPAEQGLFSDEEAERVLEATGADGLALRGDALLCLRQMNLLDVLCAPSQSLSVSYALTASDGSPQRPSAWLKLLRRLFPGLSEGDGKRRIDAWYAAGPALDALGPALRVAFASGEMAEGTLTAARCLLSSEQTAPGARQVLYALRAPREMPPLSRETVHALYRFTQLSASRLEAFARCPFRHFAQYGLALQEREEFAVDRRDTGVFCHRAMERYAQLALRHGTWPNVTRQQSDALMDEALAPVRAEWEEGPLGATAASRAQAEALCRAARRTAWTYARQMAASAFRTIAVEARFGEGERLAPLLVQRSAGKAWRLGGKIDRLDCFQAEDGTQYLRVVDYKTGAMAFDYSQAAVGLQLQLPLYLAAAAEAYPGTKPAAACYGRFADPLAQTDSRKEEEIEEKIGAQMRLKGVLLADQQVVEASEDRSALLNKDGSMRKGAGLNESEMRGLLRQAKRLAAEIAADIEAGEATPRPARVGTRLSCAQCAFAAVCGYDAQSSRAAVREAAALSRQEALARLRAEGEQP